MKIWHMLIVLIVFISIIGCQKAPETPIVGGDKDEHGCIGSAGYTWCEAKQKCLRTWEESCEEESSEEISGEESDSELTEETKDIDSDVQEIEETMSEIDSLDNELSSLEEDFELGDI
jgi:hypothetical protein